LNLKCVLYEGIDPNYSDHLNISLTAYAVRGGHIKCLKYLFQKGAILSNTLLDDAVMFKQIRCLNFLMSLGLRDPSKKEGEHLIDKILLYKLDNWSDIRSIYHMVWRLVHCGYPYSSKEKLIDWEKEMLEMFSQRCYNKPHRLTKWCHISQVF
jgi:ankyrin repeat protein